MAKITLHQQIVDKLLELGWSETTSRSRKYRVFTKEGKPDNVYVGVKGALRKGRTVTTSFSYEPQKFLFGNPAMVNRLF